jgi:hypothetical protein
LFKQAFEIIKTKGHLTEKGLLEIVGLKSVLNLGLSDKLKTAFPNFVPVSRPSFKFKGIPNPFWLAGFISGDGSFYFSIRTKTSPVSTNIWRVVSLILKVDLHIRDKEVLKAIASYFTLLNGKGSYSLTLKPYPIFLKSQSVSFTIRKFTNIFNTVIPFFDMFPILGAKSLDFADFKKVAEMVKNKEHLTSSGFKLIRKIDSTMNLRRPWDSD